MTQPRGTLRCSSSLPRSRSRPSRIVSGCGGQPGMKRSIGRTDDAPSCCSGWPADGPPLIAPAPTAITIFGAGPGDEGPVRVARRGDVLDPEPADVPADRSEDVDVRAAGVAVAGAHDPQIQRASEQPAELSFESVRERQYLPREDEVLAPAGREPGGMRKRDWRLRTGSDAPAG